MATRDDVEMGAAIKKAFANGDEGDLGSDGDDDDPSTSSGDYLSHINYKKGAQYWASCEPTIDAMLGGFAKISGIDISGSQSLLNFLWEMSDPPGKERAVDCGAGIGRITRLMLSERFRKVDLVEQCPKFLEEAKKALKNSKKIGDFICCGLQDFRPEPSTYDVIWCQWVLGYLTDDDFVQFFSRCREGLKPSGVIVVKENVTRTGDVDADDDDGSVTRPIELMKSLLQRAGLVIIKERRQGFAYFLLVYFLSNMRAWYMEDLGACADKDPRLPHMTNPPRHVTEEELRSVGVLYWKLDPENYVEDLEQIRKKRNYSYMDEIEITPEKLPNYDEKLKIFFSEHFHRDEEIRFVKRGSGYFDVRNASDEWIRIHVVAGDLLVLPAGIYHRFTLDTDNDIVARRLFVGEPVWLAIDRPNEEDPARKQYCVQLKTGFAA